MLELFIKGGPIMWPILLLSIITLATVLERFWFIIMERRSRQPAVVEQMLGHIEHGRVAEAIAAGRESNDMVARMLVHGLEHRETSLSNALIHAAGKELDRFNRGLVVMDTAVTLGPLLGLLGTVTGMMTAFGLVGGADLSTQQTAITGGIAEALIAVAFGLGVAIAAVIPFNYLHSKMEKARRELEDNANHVELLLAKH